MKPIIIFCGEDGDKITLTKKELEKICQDAFDQGFEIRDYCISDSYAVLSES